MSNGSKQSLFNACFVLFGEGDEVLIPTPAWTSYYEMVSLARAKSVPVLGDRSRDWKATAAQLVAAASPRTRGIMLNYPSNPTGAVYTERGAARSSQSVPLERGWWILSDEIYRRITYGVRPRRVLDVVTDHRDRAIVYRDQRRREGVRHDGLAHWLGDRPAGGCVSHDRAPIA